MIKNFLCFSALLVLLGACAHLEPGADPIVVRAEQSESVAAATFDTFLKIDNANRDFFRTNVPAMHGFAEYLRAPILVNGTNLLPRGLGFVASLETVKQSYKKGVASSNVLATAIAVLESTITIAQSFIAQQQQVPSITPGPAPPALKSVQPVTVPAPAPAPEPPK